MKCINPDMNKLINQYQFDLLPEEDKIKIEVHLLECEFCFQELYRLYPALEIFEKTPQKLLDAVEPKETILSRLTQLFSYFLIPAFITWWQKPATKILVPATISLVLIVILLMPTAQEYSDLAVIEKVPYQEFKFKGTIDAPPEENLFEQAMANYQRDDYASAIQQLSVYVEKEPDNIYGHYYLGVCFLLQENIDKGIEQLKLTLHLSQQQENKSFIERCYWSLGNAYLKNEEAERAQAAFKKIIELQGEHEQNAKEQLNKIRSLKNN